jgi:hypothetical protein
MHCNKCLPLILPDQIITNFCYKQTDPEMHKIRNLHSTTQEIELQMKLTRKRNHHELKNHYEIDPQMKSREHHYEIESLRLERWATTPVPAPGEVGSVDGSGLEGARRRQRALDQLDVWRRRQRRPGSTTMTVAAFRVGDRRKGWWQRFRVGGVEVAAGGLW